MKTALFALAAAVSLSACGVGELEDPNDIASTEASLDASRCIPLRLAHALLASGRMTRAELIRAGVCSVTRPQPDCVPRSTINRLIDAGVDTATVRARMTNAGLEVCADDGRDADKTRAADEAKTR